MSHAKAQRTPREERETNEVFYFAALRLCVKIGFKYRAGARCSQVKSMTRYRCRNRYRNRGYKFIAYRSADSDSEYDYEN